MMNNSNPTSLFQALGRFALSFASVIGVILALCFVGSQLFLFFSGLAVIFGHIAYFLARRSPSKFSGAGLAIGGFSAGYSLLFLTLLFLGFVKLTQREKRLLAELETGSQSDGVFRKVVLVADEDVNGDGKADDSLRDPMQLAIATDGRVFFVERLGQVKMWRPETGKCESIGTIAVEDFRDSKREDGLLGLVLDPGFATNGWIYFYYSPTASQTDADGNRVGQNVLARFTFTGEKLEPGSEKVIIRVPTDRQEPGHSGGGLAFDSLGNLFISVGDNTNPFGSDGYSPLDERPKRTLWDAQRTSANSNDLRGKVLRIRPLPDGSYAIPPGNLFDGEIPGARPEIYVMGCRNPFRISVDPKTGILYWGEPGPDAPLFKEDRGPGGLDEINQAREPGNYGWPYFCGNNSAYRKIDFASSAPGELPDAAKPRNGSRNNTGLRELPPAKPALIYYPTGQSAKFPEVNGGLGGGRAAMAGPVYYFDPKLKSNSKLPREYDHTLFIYDWMRGWIIAVHLDESEKIFRMERFCPLMTFKRPIDLKLGPDGCLYAIEWGLAWADNRDTQIIRIEYGKAQVNASATDQSSLAQPQQPVEELGGLPRKGTRPAGIARELHCNWRSGALTGRFSIVCQAGTIQSGWGEIVKGITKW